MFEDQYHYYHLPNSFNESRAQKELEHFKKVFKDYSFDEGVKIIEYNQGILFEENKTMFYRNIIEEEIKN